MINYDLNLNFGTFTFAFDRETHHYARLLEFNCHNLTIFIWSDMNSYVNIHVKLKE